MGVKSRYSKGRLQFRQGAVDDESIWSRTAASTVNTNYGVTRVSATQNATFKFDTPVLGARKTVIVADTTFVMTLLWTGATINNSTDNKIVVSPTTKTKALGYGIDLYGASTVLWYMRQGNIDVNSSQMGVAFSSS